MGSICSTTTSNVVEIHPDDAYSIINKIERDIFLKDYQLIRVAAINKCLYNISKPPVVLVDVKKVRPLSYSEMQLIYE
jgi:hypothetical protein